MFRKRRKKTKSERVEIVQDDYHIGYFDHGVEDLSHEYRYVAIAVIIIILLYGVITGDFVETWKNGATL